MTDEACGPVRLVEDGETGDRVSCAQGTLFRRWAADARRHAENEYEAFEACRKIERHRQADERLDDLARKAKDLPRKPGK